MKNGSLVKWLCLTPDTSDARGYREQWKCGTVVQCGPMITVARGIRPGDRILNILVDGEIWTTRRFGLPRLVEVSS